MSTACPEAVHRYSTVVVVVIVNPMIRRSCSSSAPPPFKVFWSSPFNLVVRNETVTSCYSLSKSCTVGLKNESAFRGELLKFPSITLGQSAENKYQVSSVLHAWRGLVCRSYKIGLLAWWTFETTELKWALEKKNSHHLSTFNCYQCKTWWWRAAFVFKETMHQIVVFLNIIQLFVYVQLSVH